MDTNVTKNCKQCKQKFTTTSGEIKWLLSKELGIYTKCPKCRKENKKKQEELKECLFEEGENINE